MVGKILEVQAKPGQKVQEDDTVIVMEAMKMEIPVVAPAGGVIREIKVTPGQMVDADEVLAVIE
jgi:biotin carboxyl carrier protein